MELVKYHALGNDYLVLDARGAEAPGAETVRRLCDRHRGVGADGILVRRDDAESGAFVLQILNPDGSEAEKSGNGLRIFARWLFDAGEVGAERFRVQTAGGEVGCAVLERGRSVRVEMGRVEFEALHEELEVGGEVLEIHVASIGNPHCVVLHDDPSESAARTLGPLIETHARFPERTNVQLAKPLARSRLRLEIWERGAGYTLSSGSSACAAAAVAHRLGLCDTRLEVEMPGGSLAVEISAGFELSQQGPVVRIADVEVDPELLV